MEQTIENIGALGRVTLIWIVVVAVAAVLVPIVRRAYRDLWR